MIAVLKKELLGFYRGFLGWLLSAFFIMIGGLYFTSINLQGGYTSFGYTLYNTCFVFLIFIPVLTMRSFAEERRNRTDQLLLTSPVSVPGIVVGKFLAHFAVFLFPVAILAICPLLMKLGGEFSNLENYCALFGYILMGAACIAIGLFISSLTENQIVAVICSFGVLLLSYLMQGIRSLFTAGSSSALWVFIGLLLLASILVGINTKSIPAGSGVFIAGGAILLILFRLRIAALVAAFSALLDVLAVFEPFLEFVGGVFSLTAAAYYITVTVLFLYFTCRSLEKRRLN